jgi:hypothetical protein
MAYSRWLTLIDDDPSSYGAASRLGEVGHDGLRCRDTGTGRPRSGTGRQ